MGGVVGTQGWNPVLWALVLSMEPSGPAWPLCVEDPDCFQQQLEECMLYTGLCEDILTEGPDLVPGCFFHEPSSAVTGDQRLPFPILPHSPG